jgi:hypothetical protein
VIGLGTWKAFDVDLSGDSEGNSQTLLSLFIKLGGRVN